MQNDYSPFDIEIEDLKSSDLISLKHVHEGWYVEYKSKMVNASAVAKAVSAFANTYGGWIFFGISEASKDDNVAGKFIGMPIGDKDAIRQKVRSALAANTQPTPYYDLKFIDGPDEELELETDRCILILHVPKSVQAPHVHKDGRIYKRVSDSSEPKPETDPHLLSQIWQRREKADRIISKWIDDNPEFSKSECNGPYLRVLLTPDDWGHSKYFLPASMKDVRAIFNGSTEEWYNTPLDTTHRTSTGFLGRQTSGNDGHSYGLTFQIDRYLNCEFVLPFRWHDLPLHKLQKYLQEYLYADDFIQIMRDSRDGSVKVMDLNYLFPALISMVSKYRAFMKLTGKDVPYFAKIILLNGWRYVPFLDDKDFMRQMRDHGVPMVMTEEVVLPIGKTAGTFLQVSTPNSQNDINESSKSATQAFKISQNVFELMGVDVFFDDRQDEERSYIDIDNLLDASKRAAANQIAIREIGRRDY